MNKSILRGKISARRSAKQGGERFEPILGYCSDIISHLNKEDSSRLTENLLGILDNFRPQLKSKKASPLIVELLDWDVIRNKESRNTKASSIKPSSKLPHHRS